MLSSRSIATSYHFTGPIALRHQVSPALPLIQLSMRKIIRLWYRKVNKYVVQFGLILDIIYKFMWYFRDGGAILEKNRFEERRYIVLWHL